MQHSAALGQKDAGIAFAIVPFTGIVFFAVVFTLGIINARQAETHTRLMLLAAISILDAAVARWVMTLFAPDGPPGPPPVFITIPPAIIAYLLLVAAIVHDWRSRGRPHKVYVIGGIVLMAIKLLNWPISTSSAWHALGDGVLALAR